MLRAKLWQLLAVVLQDMLHVRLLRRLVVYRRDLGGLHVTQVAKLSALVWVGLRLQHVMVRHKQRVRQLS